MFDLSTFFKNLFTKANFELIFWPKGKGQDLNDSCFPYTLDPNFMSPIHSWGNSSKNLNSILAQCDLLAKSTPFGFISDSKIGFSSCNMQTFVETIVCPSYLSLTLFQNCRMGFMPRPFARTKYFLSWTKLKLSKIKILSMVKKYIFCFQKSFKTKFP